MEFDDHPSFPRVKVEPGIMSSSEDSEPKPLSYHEESVEKTLEPTSLSSSSVVKSESKEGEVKTEQQEDVSGSTVHIYLNSCTGTSEFLEEDSKYLNTSDNIAHSSAVELHSVKVEPEDVKKSEVSIEGEGPASATESRNRCLENVWLSSSISKRRRCHYKGCTFSEDLDQGVKFFTFPATNKQRCREWCLRSGRDDFLELSEKQLRNRRICAKHFDNSAFMNTLQNSLMHTAVPMDHTNCNVPQPLPENQHNCILEAERETSLVEENSAVVGCTTVDEAIDNIEYTVGREPQDEHVETEDCNLHIEKVHSMHACDTSNIDINIPSAVPVLQTYTETLVDLNDCYGIETLKRKIRMKNILLSRKTAEISRLKKRLKNHKHSKFYLLTELSKYIEGAPFTFLRMQLMHKECGPWREDEKELSLAMYFRAPKLYSFLIKKGFKLPKVCTIRKWIIK